MMHRHPLAAPCTSRRPLGHKRLAVMWRPLQEDALVSRTIPWDARSVKGFPSGNFQWHSQTVEDDPFDRESMLKSWALNHTVVPHPTNTPAAFRNCALPPRHIPPGWNFCDCMSQQVDWWTSSFTSSVAQVAW